MMLNRALLVVVALTAVTLSYIVNSQRFVLLQHGSSGYRVYKCDCQVGDDFNCTGSNVFGKLNETSGERTHLITLCDCVCEEDLNCSSHFNAATATNPGSHITGNDDCFAKFEQCDFSKNDLNFAPNFNQSNSTLYLVDGRKLPRESLNNLTKEYQCWEAGSVNYSLCIDTEVLEEQCSNSGIFKKSSPRPAPSQNDSTPISAPTSTSYTISAPTSTSTTISATNSSSATITPATSTAAVSQNISKTATSAVATRSATNSSSQITTEPPTSSMSTSDTTKTTTTISISNTTKSTSEIQTASATTATPTSDTTVDTPKVVEANSTASTLNTTENTPARGTIASNSTGSTSNSTVETPQCVTTSNSTGSTSNSTVETPQCVTTSNSTESTPNYSTASTTPKIETKTTTTTQMTAEETRIKESETRAMIIISVIVGICICAAIAVCTFLICQRRTMSKDYDKQQKKYEEELSRVIPDNIIDHNTDVKMLA